MAVFTEVSDREAGELVRTLDLGQLGELRGIHGGVACKANKRPPGASGEPVRE